MTPAEYVDDLHAIAEAIVKEHPAYGKNDCKPILTMMAIGYKSQCKLDMTLDELIDIEEAIAPK